MRKYILVLLMIIAIVPWAESQITYGTSDSLSVSTSATLKTFTTRYDVATMYFVGCTGLIRWAQSDNDSTGITQDGSQSLKKWLILPEYTPFTIMKNKDLGMIGLKHLMYKCSSGTGALLVTGTKRTYAE